MNNNTSMWIKEAKKTGINLEQLKQDKVKMYKELEKRGLPTPEMHIIKEINTEQVKKLINSKVWFCRLIPKSGGKIRPYKLQISSFKEFKEFCSDYEIDKYTVQIVEKDTVEWTVAIVKEKDVTIVELCQGNGPDLTHGKKTPITAIRKKSGTEYLGSKPTKQEESIIEKVCAYLKEQKDFYGYYEVDVRKEGKMLFRNYQKSGTPWTNILTNLKTSSTSKETDL